MNNPHRIRRLESRARLKKKSAPTVEAWRADCGSDRRRSGDLTIFSRTLYQLSYRALRIEADTQRPRLRDEFLHLNHAARATPTGLEPATSAVTGRRANQLRHGANLLACRLSPARVTLAALPGFGKSGFVTALPPGSGPLREEFPWHPQRDSNPCCRRERAES